MRKQISNLHEAETNAVNRAVDEQRASIPERCEWFLPKHAAVYTLSVVLCSHTSPCAHLHHLVSGSASFFLSQHPQHPGIGVQLQGQVKPTQVKHFEFKSIKIILRLSINA